MSSEETEATFENKIDYFKDEDNSISKYRQENLDIWFNDYVKEVTLFDNFFLKNFKGIQYEWVQTEGVQRITQSMVNLLNKCNDVDLLKYKKMFKVFIEHSTIQQNNIFQQSLQVLEPFLKAHHPKYAHCLYTFDWSKHRNTCIILICLLDIVSLANHEIRCQIFEYFLWIIQEAKLLAPHWDTLYYALIGIQKIVLRFGMYREKLVHVLHKVTILSDEFCQFESENLSKFNSFKHQIGLCASWFVNHVLKEPNLEKFTLPVKISQNKLSARCNENAKFYNVFSKYKITKGIFFYEIILITDGKMRIGWNCNFDRPGWASKLGSDKHSIAFNGFKKQVWHNMNHEDVDMVHSWKAGDVIGCLIDIDNEKDDYFAFYVNGTLIRYNFKTFFNTSTNYLSFQPSVTLYTGQQCTFNFGPKFKEFPNDYPFVRDFYSAINNNANFQQNSLYSKYDSRNKFSENSRFFRSEIIIDKFNDNCQKFQDMVICQWLCNTKESIYSSTFYLNTDEEKINQLLRLFQSVVSQVNSSTVNLYEFNCNLYEKFFASENNTFLAKIIPPILKMFGFFFNFDEQTIFSKIFLVQLRNLCLMLLLVLYNINYSEEEKSDDPHLKQLMDFFLKIIENCEHQETVLYAVMCIELLAKEIKIDSETKGKIIQGLTFLAKHIDRWHSFIYTCKPTKLKVKNLEKLNILDNNLTTSNQLKLLSRASFFCTNCETSDNPVIEYQVGFFASSCLYFVENMYDLKNIQTFREKVLKFSSNYFSTSSELSNKISSTAHSAYPIKYSEINCNSYFYEAILLTNGPMKIGWTTKDENFIGFDLYRSQLWHKEENVKIEDLPKIYHIGNVVGCLIEISPRKAEFTFYLNGIQIEYSTALDEIDKPLPTYYAAALIENFQHCYFNFGQVPFKYLPSTLSSKEFTDFHSETKGVNRKYHLKRMQSDSNEQKQLLLNNVDSDKETAENAKLTVLYDKQEFDELVEVLENRVLHNNFDRKLLIKLTKLKNSDVIHLMQSIICQFGNNLGNSKIEIFVGWINSFVSLSDFNNIKQFIDKLMTTSKLEDIVEQRKICIVLWILDHIKPKNDLNFENYYEEIVSFVLKVFTKSSDNWCLLSAIYCLHKIYFFEIFRNMMGNNKKFSAKLDKLASTFDKTNFYENIDPVLVQVLFCAQHFIQSNRHLRQLPQNMNNCTLVPYTDMDLVLSKDRFSVRNFNSSKAKSINSSITISTSGIYFYETIIHTSGFMEIGWSMMQADSKSARQNYSPKYKNSILLDLFSMHVWSCKKQAAVTNCTNWNAGDVIGCLIELEFSDCEDFNGKIQKNIILKNFIFYLNGKTIQHGEIEFGTKINISNEPVVFASIRLAIYQQCYCNFGQREFRFPPRNISYKTFQDISEELQVLPISAEHKQYEQLPEYLSNNTTDNVHTKDQFTTAKTTLQITPLLDEELEINHTELNDYNIERSSKVKID